MAASDALWKDDIRCKLITIYENDAETLIRILFYLDSEDQSYRDCEDVAPAWRTLKQSLNSERVFRMYASRLAEDTKRGERDEAFRRTMNTVYAQMMEASENSYADETFQDFDIARVADMKVTTVSGFMGLARAWELIPVASQTQILDILPKIVANKQLVTCVDEVVGIVNKAGGTVVMVALAAIHLSYDAIKNLIRWSKGEISGKRCAKNIVDSSFTIGAGVVGGLGGASIGSMFGPFGTVIGGIAGGIISSQAISVLIDRLTQSVFGIPKDEALENAYNYFGVRMSATNNEINTSFRRLCLKHHPDKGGNNEDFLITQVNMGVIKLARGEM